MVGGNPPPIFSTEIEPLAQMTQYLTDKNVSCHFLGAAKITIPLRTYFVKLYYQQNLTPQMNRGDTRAGDSRDSAKNGPNRDPLTVAWGSGFCLQCELAMGL